VNSRSNIWIFNAAKIITFSGLASIVRIGPLIVVLIAKIELHVIIGGLGAHTMATNSSASEFPRLRQLSTMSLPKIVLPGQPLGKTSEYSPGQGTHILPSSSNTIYASILGPLTVLPTTSSRTSQLSISRQLSATQQLHTSPLLPKEGNIILGRVTRINIREARVQILVINDLPTMEEFFGVIR
jgi:hypothetical protein